MKRTLFIAALFYFFSSVPSHAFKFSLVGAANKSNPQVDGTTYSPQWKYGGGLLLEMGVGANIGLELGFLKLNREYQYRDTGIPPSQITISHDLYEVPLAIRANSQYLSFGVGGYYAKYTGSEKQTTQTAGGSVSSTSLTYAAAKHAKDDYGFLASLALDIPFGQALSVLFDGRYTMGIKDQDLGVPSKTYNDIQILTGLRWGF